MRDCKTNLNLKNNFILKYCIYKAISPGCNKIGCKERLNPSFLLSAFLYWQLKNHFIYYNTLPRSQPNQLSGIVSMGNCLSPSNEKTKNCMPKRTSSLINLEDSRHVMIKTGPRGMGRLCEKMEASIVHEEKFLLWIMHKHKYQKIPDLKALLLVLSPALLVVPLTIYRSRGMGWLY